MTGAALRNDMASRGAAAYQAPELAVIVPTLDERDNVAELVPRLQRALKGIAWEAIFVDDDSRDGTVDVLENFQRLYPNIRCLRRVGRHGLASACIEGMLASAAPYLAVMDADLQHDERVLPRMLDSLRSERIDIVIGSRFVTGANADNLPRRRLLLSLIANRLSRMIAGADLSDPMSGFFMLRREFLNATVHRLSGVGFKILLDLMASAPRPVRFRELPFELRTRRHGSSKLDLLVMLEYVALLGDKLLGRTVPWRFVVFVLVGSFGLLVHLAVLALCLKLLALPFYQSQVVATLVAMTINFNLNNILTYRDQRLRGYALIYGHASFYLICSIGAVANFQIAELLYHKGVPWAPAGLLGAVVGAVWNYGVSSIFTWRRRS